ncbi:hypothetical protein PoMZ_01886 [Pyricularia oryzae]|uniref:beta-N-acetylhexosaminidase n=1 Tax=Pyricularia oryzae TaxID=318829 RepID=A0A4P7N3C5_PYROR|nr:hypothetical protein PoMZ_01886 [Pyricularia oryzae]
MRSPVALILALAAAKPALGFPGIPTTPFTQNGDGVLDLTGLKAIVVNELHADSRDTKGSTLIPPTLEEFAKTFAADVKSVFGHEISVTRGSDAAPDAIFLTLGEAGDYLDVAGRETSEGYTLETASEGVTITGASPLGVWWGTRTLVQQALLGQGTLPLGRAVDSPGWNSRGMMIDAARHYYPAEFLIDMCSYMSFFKQNTFQLHLSDNLWNNARIYTYERQMELYAAFRLDSDDPAVAGLNKRQNESYTRDVFDEIQTKCAARGVTILPEIETPGHALVISQWKPEIGMSSDYSLLNISHPDTIPTVKEIWRVFLPWFQSKVVSIGADEYRDESLEPSALADEYTRFVNEMNDFIVSTSGKKVRVWGTFPPRKGGHVDTSVSVQHWAPWEAEPVVDWLPNGYSVMNSGDRVYIVGKWSEPYPQELNQDFIFHGTPGGGAFAPNIFDPNNATFNVPRNESKIEGHIAPLWNDYGPNSTTVLETYWSWRNGLPALADKQWGGELTETEYPALFAALQPHVPDQNLERKVASQGPTILEYNFASGQAGEGGQIQDLSGNNYHATTTCADSNDGIVLDSSCSVKTPLSSKGRNYTLSFSIKPTSDAKGPIFTGPDSALWYGNGTIDRVMMFSGESVYALNYTFPVGEWVDAKLIGSGDRMYLDVSASSGGTTAPTGPMEFLTIIGWNGERFVWEKMAFEAPLATIGGGGFEGVVSRMKLVDD